MKNPYTDQELLQLLAGGSEKAFKILFDTYFKRLFYYISGFIKSEPVAEELVMDVFTKIWIGRESAVQINNLDAFLFRVARNKCIDFLRSVASDLQFKELLWHQLDIASTDRADDFLLLQDYESKLRTAVDLLSPQRKKAFNLSRDEELSHDEIARELNISKATVNNHIVEAKKFIRNYLSNAVELVLLFLVSAT